jgi:hypothetical protein
MRGLGAAQDAVGFWRCCQVAFMDPQLRAEPVGVGTAVRGVVAVGQQHVGHRAEGSIPGAQGAAPARSVDHHEGPARPAQQVRARAGGAWRVMPAQVHVLGQGERERIECRVNRAPTTPEQNYLAKQAVRLRRSHDRGYL